MTGFVLAAAALTLVTLALLVVPLVRRRALRLGATQAEVSIAVLRDQMEELERDRASGTLGADAYETGQRTLKQRILQDAVPDARASDRIHAAPAVVLAMLLPLAAAGLYFVLGTPSALDSRKEQAQTQEHLDAGQMEAAVARLAQRLQSTPDDLEGWTMLARSYRVLGRHQDAVAAYARAEKLIASDPPRLTEWAESLALAGGGTLAGKPAELVARALAVDPDFGHALALAGAAAFERKDYGGAIAYWERLAKQFQPGSEEGETVARSLAAARDELAKNGSAVSASPAKALKPAPVAAAEPAKAAATFRLKGKVTLAPGLAGKASPEDAVFIFARAAGGPPMPLAVLRRQVKDLPVEFTLDESNAMMAQGQLDAIGEVVVGARVSRSGKPMAQSGDLQGLSRPVKIGASGIQVVIDAALP